jgi:hypothetical protein
MGIKYAVDQEELEKLQMTLMIPSKIEVETQPVSIQVRINDYETDTCEDELEPKRMRTD